MTFKIFKIFTFLFSFTLLFSCKNETKNLQKKVEAEKEISLKYAKGFTIQYFDDYKKLIIKTPYQNSKETFEFILSDKKNDFKSIQTPVNSVVVTSTTHIPILELLGVENKLVGYPNTKYISSVKTRKLIDEGKIQDLGNEENMNTELLLNLQPDLVIGFSITSNNKMFTTIEKMGIPVILNGSWLEETPLGRAEWIKVFGVLFNKEKEADSIFNSVEKKYLEVKNIALESKRQPSILSGGLFKDIWNLPAGNSFEATFLTDANTNYLWKNSIGNGSLSLNIENVFDKGKDADIWISPSFYTSFSQLETANDIYPQFKAFQNGNVFTFVNSKGPTGGILYFELSTARPDLVLKDLIKITHPELLKDYEFTFFEKLE